MTKQLGLSDEAHAGGRKQRELYFSKAPAWDATTNVVIGCSRSDFST